MFSTLRTLIDRSLDRIDNAPLNPGNLVLTFLGIFSVRYLIELNVDTHAFFNVWHILHHGLFFAISFMTYAMIVAFFSKQNPMQTLKTVISLGFVIWLAPFVAVIFSNGGPVIMQYLHSDTTPLWVSFLGFFYSAEDQINIGIRIEVALIFGFIFYYLFFYKKINLIKSFTALFVVYVATFIFGIYPKIFGFYSAAFGQGFFDQTETWNICLAIIFLIELLALLSWGNKKLMLQIWGGLKSLRLLHFLVLFLLGVIFIDRNYFTQTDFNSFKIYHYVLFLGLSVVMAFLCSESMKTKYSPFTTAMLALLSMAFAINHSWQNLILIIYFLLISYILYYPPLLFSKVPLVNTFLLSLQNLIIFLSGVVTVKGFVHLPVNILIPVMIAFALGFYFLDLASYTIAGLFIGICFGLIPVLINQPHLLIYFVPLGFLMLIVIRFLKFQPIYIYAGLFLSYAILALT